MRHPSFPTAWRALGIAALVWSANAQATDPTEDPAEPSGPGRDTLYQVSTIDALLAGLYDGVRPVGELLAFGDFGLGTFDRLDGEMLVFEGRVYQAAVDGSVNLMPSETTTPFAAVTWFDADLAMQPPTGLDYAGFKAWVEARLPSPNLAYAIRLDGRFDSIRYRSVPAQSKPYRPLAQVTEAQTLFDRTDIEGTLIGFWGPAFTKGINVPGFHLHFLSADRAHAGHLLDFRLAEGRLALDPTAGWEIQLPTDPAYLGADLTADRSAALHRVEQGGAVAAQPEEDRH